MNRTGRYQKRGRCAPVALLWVLFLIPVTPVSAVNGPGEEPGAALENMVLQDCGSCHGLTLKGGLGPPLRPKNLTHYSTDAIATIIREGVPGTAMPAWKPLLTPEDIDWISLQLKEGALISP